ncbi:MAG: rhomboid family intramembrane serine protease [Candidatus Aenigmarchaeota archaeon]|nr:rhomboid family intramembrane serine protease [Candidatus Aenigmarchaeota archaeon]
MKLTYWLILLMFVVFFLQIFFIQSAESFAFSSISMIERPWTILTSVFMHANLLHLLSNVFVFFFFGLAVEEEMGKGKMLLVFLLGAVLGNIASIAVYPAGVLFLGASAGIFALVGTGMLVRPLDWSVAPFLLPLPLIFLGIIYAVLNIYAFTSGVDEGISYAGHLAGLVIGLAFGFRYTGFRKGAKRIVLGAIALIILLMAIIFALSYFGAGV